jgi:hypothetical protein
VLGDREPFRAQQRERFTDSAAGDAEFVDQRGFRRQQHPGRDGAGQDAAA